MGHRDWGGSPFSFCVSAGKTQVSEAAGPPKKKRKRAQKKSREREEKTAEPKAQAPAEKSQARTPVAAKEKKGEAFSSTGAPADGLANEPGSLFALDVLRQRLHEKIREARGQVGGGDLWVLWWFPHPAWREDAQ
ncbi:hypothetical protein E2I00_001773, partial [Balaenoptera physalus]